MSEGSKPPKGKPTGRSPRARFSTIGFHVSCKLHEAMKALAEERHLKFDEVYCEAVTEFLGMRDAEEVVYVAAPFIDSAARVHMRIDPELCEKMRAAAKSDCQGLANAFETAVRFYLQANDRQI